ncbi:MAG TPA: methylated-DNA--[protein]-cysteine S-methyltransferase, partial [Pelobium sp.]|nr:methylated-DNA--[protein]-cysteine S-methyltransferase [Pelobium sp.]
TDFQLKVWEALLNISFGDVSTYGNIAKQVDSQNASRAVGTAIGSNPVALIIPCHRVIQNTGKLGGYMWGLTRKSAILGWEAVKVDNG